MHVKETAVHPDDTSQAAGARKATRVVAVLGATVVLCGLVLRFVATSDLWLDEALSVNIARLGWADIGDALRHDGHPPLYYLLLHGWMELVGDGDWAVRSLSGVFAVATLPVAWIAGRRYAGLSGAATVVLLLAVSPFALRYANEARMYSLVMLLVFGGWLAVRGAWERPSIGRLALVTVVSGLLLLTHYWSVYLILAAGALFAWLWWRGRGRGVAPAAGRLFAAVALGGVLFLPWLPAFLEQAGNTGTPWGGPERPTVVLMVSLRDFGGAPPSAEGELLGIGLALLAVVGAVGRAADGRGVALHFRARSDAWPEAAVLVGTLLFAVAFGYLSNSAFASRYMAVVFPLVLLLAGLGATRLSPRARGATLAVLLALSFVGAARNVTFARTQGGDVAEMIDRTATTADVVGFCPDQLGPATDRYLDAPVRALTYPDGDPPQRVDWVDYAERVEGREPARFARRLLDEAGPGGTIWLVWRGGYRTHGEDCEAVANALAEARPGVQIRVEAAKAFESMWLYEYPAA